MTTKLIIHKFDSDIPIKTLKITIHEDEKSVVYSDWSEIITQNKTEVSKSSRLVVKLVSGPEPNYFNLEKCAKKLGNNAHGNACCLSVIQNKKFDNENCIDTLNEQTETVSGNDAKKEMSNKNRQDIMNSNYLSEANLKYNLDVRPHEKVKDNHSPLEYSLEKVKENNARIMENIHMLNRTLNYTKERELMDNYCSKANMRTFPCNSCGKCFVYETGLKRHNSIQHSTNEMQPRWQVVWTCMECFQVWPRLDLALKHSRLCCKTGTDECVKEMKTSSLLQCEFCEKVFTSIPRLLKHSKSHTTANNYECSPCNLVFSSYKAAEKHWVICPFLKICYHFSLAKMLLCNACDRKFKTYEQLYNHRYKVNHFTTKLLHSRGTCISIGMLAYQCEVCGHWFTTLPSLQSHRQQAHPL